MGFKEESNKVSLPPLPQASALPQRYKLQTPLQVGPSPFPLGVAPEVEGAGQSGWILEGEGFPRRRLRPGPLGWDSLLCSQCRPAKPVRQVHLPLMWSQLAPF